MRAARAARLFVLTRPIKFLICGVVVAVVNRELQQWRRWQQQEHHKFAYLTMKNSSFARFAPAFFIFKHFADVLDLSTTWNDLFCSCVDDVSIWWHMFNFVLSLKSWFQFNSKTVRTHFASIMTLNNWEMTAETQSYIFRWRSCSRRRCLWLSSVMMRRCEALVWYKNAVSDLESYWH